MKLTKKEIDIVGRFREILDDRFPDEITDILIFGSKARGGCN